VATHAFDFCDRHVLIGIQYGGSEIRFALSAGTSGEFLNQSHQNLKFLVCLESEVRLRDCRKTGANFGFRYELIAIPGQ
jgi:hypothetical protein